MNFSNFQIYFKGMFIVMISFFLGNGKMIGQATFSRTPYLPNIEKKNDFDLGVGVDIGSAINGNILTSSNISFAVSDLIYISGGLNYGQGKDKFNFLSAPKLDTKSFLELKLGVGLHNINNTGFGVRLDAGIQKGKTDFESSGFCGLGLFESRGCTTQISSSQNKYLVTSITPYYEWKKRIVDLSVGLEYKNANLLDEVFSESTNTSSHSAAKRNNFATVFANARVKMADGWSLNVSPSYRHDFLNPANDAFSIFNNVNLSMGISKKFQIGKKQGAKNIF